MKVETKHNIGDSVCTIWKNDIFWFDVKLIQINFAEDKVGVNYIYNYSTLISLTQSTVNSEIFDEARVFKTKEELIDSL